MYPVTRIHNDVPQNVRDEQIEGPPERIDPRRESERRDRLFVRDSLDNGVPAKEIEKRLLASTQFQRLNPDQDLLAYVRGLISEESGSIHAVGSRAEEGANAPELHKDSGRASTSRGTVVATSQLTAQQYIRENFQTSDWLAVVVRNRENGETIQRIATAERIASDEFQAWLRHKNAKGSDVYLGLNSLKEQAHGRTKADLNGIRHLYLDLDEDGPKKLAAIQTDGRVPKPNYVLATSPEKYQVVWRVSGINQEDAESLLRGMAQHYGGDPAATDSTRVFRLPGFNNKKYGKDFKVVATRHAPAENIYAHSEFTVETAVTRPSLLTSGLQDQERTKTDTNGSQSERDWSYALRHLENGDDPKQIVRQIALYRSVDHYDPAKPSEVIAPKKPNPHYYAERTVARAASHLGISPHDKGENRNRAHSSQPER